MRMTFDEKLKALSRVHDMQSVWFVLERKFLRVDHYGYNIWLARRNGLVRTLVERDERYASLASKPLGPETDAEWVLLAMACMEAIGKPVENASQLHEYPEEYLAACAVLDQKP